MVEISCRPETRAKGSSEKNISSEKGTRNTAGKSSKQIGNELRHEPNGLAVVENNLGVQKLLIAEEIPHARVDNKHVHIRRK